jgi:hypothetical protein
VGWMSLYDREIIVNPIYFGASLFSIISFVQQILIEL